MGIQGNSEYRPKCAGGYTRISDDRLGLEKGVARQTEDIYERGSVIGWTVGKIYTENDTSAYKKRKITLPDGRVVWRVIRPEFSRMLDDFQRGRIDGIIVWDLDRLVRQPRDLEDLIDLVEACGRPVTGVTGTIDLMTSSGRAMARVLTAMANKASEDTARRVARASLQDAREGRIKMIRRFGYTEKGKIVEAEAEALRWAARRVINGDSWSGIVRALEQGTALERGVVRPLNGGHWTIPTLRNQLINPTIAGLAVYRGMMRDRGERRSDLADPKAAALKNADGSYVKNGLPEILTVEEWEAVADRISATRRGVPLTVSPRAKKYLLSGLLRCRKVREDGTICNRVLSGTRIAKVGHPGETYVVYRCPTKVLGGCGGTWRRADQVDQLIERLFFEYLAREAPRQSSTAAPASPATQERTELNEAQQRLADLNQQYALGTVSGQTYFATVGLLEARIKQLTAEVAKQVESAARLAPMRTAAQVTKEWKAADTHGKRTILAKYLHAIEVSPSETTGPGTFDRNAIQPVWKQYPTAD